MHLLILWGPTSYRMDVSVMRFCTWFSCIIYMNMLGHIWLFLRTNELPYGCFVMRWLLCILAKEIIRSTYVLRHSIFESTLLFSGIPAWYLPIFTPRIFLIDPSHGFRWGLSIPTTLCILAKKSYGLLLYCDTRFSSPVCRTQTLFQALQLECLSIFTTRIFLMHTSSSYGEV